MGLLWQECLKGRAAWAFTTSRVVVFSWLLLGRGLQVLGLLCRPF
jgi:hypothetical protein